MNTLKHKFVTKQFGLCHGLGSFLVLPGYVCHMWNMQWKQEIDKTVEYILANGLVCVYVNACVN